MRTQQEEARFLTVPEYAALMRVDPRTVRRWIRQGKIEAARTPGGRQFRIPEDQRPGGD